MRSVANQCPRPTQSSLACQPNKRNAVPEDLVELSDFLPLVKSIACRIYARIPPYASIELGDLIQSGHLGLVNAGRTYLRSRNVPFAAYARFRIRGEILDSLRQVDVASRGMRRLDRRVKAAISELSADLQRDPTESEVSQKLRLDPRLAGGEREIQFMRIPPVTITSLDDRDTERAQARVDRFQPESLRSAAEARQLLADVIARLPNRSKELILLYYHSGLTMREIGERFNVNESRVSQIHRRALECMARQLRAAGVCSAGDI
jgi:RNA polymerase sigma factor for flagellar operon FliA